jgi:hypothetical protein
MTVTTSPSTAMAILDGIGRTLAECVDLDEIQKSRNQAEMILHCIKAAALGLEMQNKAAEMKLCCERKLGTILREMLVHGGDHRSEHRIQGMTLEQLGIDKSKSSRWQREALVTDEDFALYVQHTREEGRELSSNGLLRLARLHADAAEPVSEGDSPFGRLVGGLKNLARQQKQFACIYADPPWPRGGSKSGITQLPKRLCALPVKLVAAPQAHMHLWVPPESLEAGLAVCVPGASTTRPRWCAASRRWTTATTGGSRTRCCCWASGAGSRFATAVFPVGWTDTTIPRLRSTPSSRGPVRDPISIFSVRRLPRAGWPPGRAEVTEGAAVGRRPSFWG